MRFIEVMIAGPGVEFQEHTIASGEEEGHVQCSEAKEGLEEANGPHTVPPEWRGSGRCCG